jgi:uncharacterized protein
VAGTIAMFLVGGGILAHGIPPIHHLAEALSAAAGPLGSIMPTLIDGLTGVIAGALLVAGFNLIQRLRRRIKKAPLARDRRAD